MKKIVVLMFGVLPFVAFGQKEIKPNVANAEKALKAGKIDEAKAIIDITTASQEFMVDKKGAPSKNAAKAWFLKGVIYAAIDTTKNEKFKSLAPEGFAVAKESFDKALQIDQDKTPAFLTDAAGFPLMNDQVNAFLAQSYFDKAIKAYQDDKDYKRAFDFTEKTMYFIPQDTSVLMNAGVFFAPAAEEFDKAVSLIKQYHAKGGKSADSYIVLVDIFYNKKKDTQEAIKLLQEAKKANPTNKDFAQTELSIYLNDKKYDVAKQMVEASLKEDPNNNDQLYLLGRLQQEMGESENAKKTYSKVLAADPKNFDAAAMLADLYWKDAKVEKDKMSALGNSKADLAKAMELDKIYVEKLKIALPYVEACEKISPDDVNVLYSLLTIYGDLDIQASATRVKKRLKTLGEEVD
ncbi:MAG TPA: tetratricopeptide repeat protein [Cyclobacteriaceae bacterium]|jgi:tetratricopeptide (TPR) repeat protein|nr:tetratricopeptide repeat protein [Cyclobacteriaceae bacterium]HRE67242.1 tetratricopeptide repeat protein [Cyclobacteriaceae bacterium]HRF34116.1 tetratricopeptide repeat protein [Cyclobacteriaceae bacterium]